MWECCGLSPLFLLDLVTICCFCTMLIFTVIRIHCTSKCLHLTSQYQNYTNSMCALQLSCRKNTDESYMKACYSQLYGMVETLSIVSLASWVKRSTQNG